MGLFSGFANRLKKELNWVGDKAGQLADEASAVYHQVNPWDDDATFKTEMKATREADKVKKQQEAHQHDLGYKAGNSAWELNNSIANGTYKEGSRFFDLQDPKTSNANDSFWNWRVLEDAVIGNTWDDDTQSRLLYDPWAENPDDAFFDGSEYGSKNLTEWAKKYKDVSFLERKAIAEELISVINYSEDPYAQLGAMNTLTMIWESGAFLEQDLKKVGERAAKSHLGSLVDLGAGISQALGDEKGANWLRNLKEEQLTAPVLTEQQQVSQDYAGYGVVAADIGTAIVPGQLVKNLTKGLIAKGTKQTAKTVAKTTAKTGLKGLPQSALNVSKRFAPSVAAVATEEAIFELRNYGRTGEFDLKSALGFAGLELGLEGLGRFKTADKVWDRAKGLMDKDLTKALDIAEDSKALTLSADARKILSDPETKGLVGDEITEVNQAKLKELVDAGDLEPQVAEYLTRMADEGVDKVLADVVAKNTELKALVQDEFKAIEETTVAKQDIEVKVEPPKDTKIEVKTELQKASEDIMVKSEAKSREMILGKKTPNVKSKEVTTSVGNKGIVLDADDARIADEITDNITTPSSAKGFRVKEEMLDIYTTDPDRGKKIFLSKSNLDNYSPTEQKEILELMETSNPRGTKAERENFDKFRRQYTGFHIRHGKGLLSEVSSYITNHFDAEFGKTLKTDASSRKLRNFIANVEQMPSSTAGSQLRYHQKYGNIFGADKVTRRTNETLGDTKNFSDANIDNFVKDKTKADVSDINSRLKKDKNGKIPRSFQKYITDGKLNDRGKALWEDMNKRMGDTMSKAIKRFEADGDLPVNSKTGKMDWETVYQSSKFRSFKNQIEQLQAEQYRFSYGLTPRTYTGKILNFFDKGVSLRYASMLSGVQTAVKVATGTLTMRGIKGHERRLAEGIKMMATFGKRGHFNPTKRLSYALKKNKELFNKQAIEDARHMYKNSDALYQSRDLPGVLQRTHRTPWESWFGRHIGSIQERLVSSIFSGIDGLLQRGFRADEMRTTIANQLKKSGESKKVINQVEDDLLDFYLNPNAKGIQAKKEAWETTVKESIQKVDSNISATEADGFMQNIYDITDNAVQQAKLADKDRFHGAVGKITNFLDKTKLSGIFPFSRTRLNQLAETMDRVPGLGILHNWWDYSYKNKKKMLLPGDPQNPFKSMEWLSKVAAEQATGIATLVLGFWGADYLTGGFPDSEREREEWKRQGKLPNAINVGKLMGGDDDWKNIDVLNFLFVPAKQGIVVRDVINNELNPGRDDNLGDFMVNMMAETVGGYEEISFNKDIKFLEELANADTDDRGDIISDEIFRFGNSFLSGMIKTINKIESGGQEKDAVTWQEKLFLKDLPLLSGQVGDRQYLGKGMKVSPFEYLVGVKSYDTSDYKDDAVFNMIDELTTEGYAKEYFTVGGLDITDLKGSLGGDAFNDLSVEDRKIMEATLGESLKDNAKEIQRMEQEYSTTLYNEISRFSQTDLFKEADGFKQLKYLNNIKSTIHGSMKKEYLLRHVGQEYIPDLNPREEALAAGQEVIYSGGGDNTPAEKIMKIQHEIRRASPEEVKELERDLSLLKVEEKWYRDDRVDVLDTYKIGSSRELSDKLHAVYEEEGWEAAKSLYNDLVRYSTERQRTTGEIVNAKWVKYNKHGRIVPSKSFENLMSYGEINESTSSGSTSVRRGLYSTGSSGTQYIRRRLRRL